MQSPKNPVQGECFLKEATEVGGRVQGELAQCKAELQKAQEALRSSRAAHVLLSPNAHTFNPVFATEVLEKQVRLLHFLVSTAAIPGAVPNVSPCPILRFSALWHALQLSSG